MADDEFIDALNDFVRRAQRAQAAAQEIIDGLQGELVETTERKEHDEHARRVLAFLNRQRNDRLGTRGYEYVDSNLKFIRARLEQLVSHGHDIDEAVRLCKIVVLRKIREAGDDDEPFRWKWVRPETLFNATKFNQYLGEIPEEDRRDARE